MKKLMMLLPAAAMLFGGSAARSFTGVITDSMCLANHTQMHISPDPKCIVDCVRASRSVKFVLLDGKTAYLLSDQVTPSKFAGRKVLVTGTANGSNIQVMKIEETK